MDDRESSNILLPATAETPKKTKGLKKIAGVVAGRNIKKRPRGH